MVAIWEVVRRSKQGPIMREADFDLKRLVPKVREVVEKYGIKFDREVSASRELGSQIPPSPQERKASACLPLDAGTEWLQHQGRQYPDQAGGDWHHRRFRASQERR